MMTRQRRPSRRRSPQTSGPRAGVAGSPPRPRRQYWRRTSSTSTTATSADHCSPNAQELASGGLRTAAHSDIRVLADDGRRSNYRTASRTDDERDRQARTRVPRFLARVAADARPKITWVWSSAGDDLCCALQSKRAVVADGLGSPRPDQAARTTCKELWIVRLVAARSSAATNPSALTNRACGILSSARMTTESS